MESLLEESKARFKEAIRKDIGSRTDDFTAERLAELFEARIDSECPSVQNNHFQHLEINLHFLRILQEFGYVNGAMHYKEKYMHEPVAV